MVDVTQRDTLGIQPVLPFRPGFQCFTLGQLVYQLFFQGIQYSPHGTMSVRI